MFEIRHEGLGRLPARFISTGNLQPNEELRAPQAQQGLAAPGAGGVLLDGGTGVFHLLPHQAAFWSVAALCFQNDRWLARTMHEPQGDPRVAGLIAGCVIGVVCHAASAGAQVCLNLRGAGGGWVCHEEHIGVGHRRLVVVNTIQIEAGHLAQQGTMPYAIGRLIGALLQTYIVVAQPAGGTMFTKALPTLAFGLVAVLAATAPALAGDNPYPVNDSEKGAAHAAAVEHGHHLKLDGKFGAQTEAAVRRYQERHNLKADGIVGAATRKSLGMPSGRKLKRGVYGDDVKTVQRLLSHHEDAWHDKAAEAKPAPVAAAPAAKAPAAKPAPAARPVVVPVPAPTPEPWTPVPVVVAPSVEEAKAAKRSSFEVYGGNWFLPRYSSAYDFDWTMTRPSYMAGLSLWADDWGLAGEFTQLPALFVGSNQVFAGGAMYDAQVKWRDFSDTNRLAVGYRTLGGQHLGTLSYGLELPVVSNWLCLRGAALGGTNFGSGWMADGRLGLGVHLGPVTLDGGWRALGLSGVAGVNQLVWTQAPYANLGLRF